MCEESDAGKERLERLVWSDDKCYDIALKSNFPASVQDLAVQKQVITRFLKFYLGGRRENGLGVDDLVFAVLAIMPFSPYNETIVWPNGLFTDDGTLFFLSPEEKLAADVIKTNQPKKQNQGNNIDTESEKHNEIGTGPESDEKDIICFDEMDDLPEELHCQSLQSTSDEPHLSLELDLDLETVLNDNNDKADLAPCTIWQKITFDPKPVPQNYAMINYGPVDNAAFISFCNTVLENWDNDSVSRTVLKSFFAVVALVLMRATAKSYRHLAATFHSEKFLRFLRHMKIAAPKLRYAPPHKRCLKRAFKTFSRKGTNTPIMFAKLILIRKGVTDKYLMYLISNALLNYTADYGLNLVMLWKSIHTAVSTKDVECIVELTTCDETRYSWERLTSFFSKYKSTECKDFSYRWARILDARYFRELSCRANYALAVVLAVFAERIAGNTGVWQATWVNNDDEENRLKQFGSQLYEQYLHLKTN